ncbi:MAG: methyltransferase domain-containing protein [Candidatus Aminicenantes bacterium]|jgi:SAM-dependent methyltransferase
MRRKIEIALLVVVVGAALAALILTDGGKPFEKSHPGLSIDEITVRNVTKGTVRYFVKPNNSFKKPEKKSIKPGDLHRYNSKVAMDVTYERLGRDITRQLAPGIPYAFRYDENNLVHLYEGSHGRSDIEDLAPYVATPREVVEKMLQMAQVDKSDVLYDLGCGDGRIVITAAKKYGARGVGVDIDSERIRESLRGAQEAGVEELVEFRLEDATKTDLSEATVLALYLLPESNALLRPKFEKELRPGTYIVTHDYRIPGWEDKEIDAVSMEDLRGKNHTIFLYQR